jgi:magnesium-transporting ATPase (P-type)
VGMIDPPRPEALEAVRVCQAAGVAVKMITGDHRLTAEAIGAQLGLGRGGKAVTGQELQVTSDEDLRELSEKTDVFARVAPEHKLRLVRALQARHHVVAMTGDGVNDAPALRQANIGVAMGITGTAVSREASDLVLADDNFASIAAAVEEGRRVYDNLIKALAFVLPTNLGLALILTAAVVAFPLQVIDGLRVPLLPIRPSQILWINLVSAVALSLPLAFEVGERNIMRRPPRDPQAHVMSGFLVARTVLVALWMAAGAVGLFLWEYRAELGQQGYTTALAEAQTMAVTTVVLFQVFYLFNCRSLSDSVWKIGFFSNRRVFYGVGVLAVLHLGFIYLPPLQQVFGTAALSPQSLGLCALVGSLILPAIALEKAWLNRAARRREQGARA